MGWNHALLLAGLSLSAANAAAAERIFELNAAEETEMALSAAPEHLRAEARVYRLGAAGFEQVRPGTNGFTCMVIREPRNGLGPICFDREGSETLLNQELLRGQWLRAGRSFAEIDRMLDAEYAARRLSPPRRSGVAYMLSEHFTEEDPQTGQRRRIYVPHVMFYAPYLRNADIGSDRRHFGSQSVPWILNEGEPNGYIIVVPQGAAHDDHAHDGRS